MHTLLRMDRQGLVPSAFDHANYAQEFEFQGIFIIVYRGFDSKIVAVEAFIFHGSSCGSRNLDKLVVDYACHVGLDFQYMVASNVIIPVPMNDSIKPILAHATRLYSSLQHLLSRRDYYTN